MHISNKFFELTLNIFSKLEERGLGLPRRAASRWTIEFFEKWSRSSMANNFDNLFLNNRDVWSKKYAPKELIDLVARLKISPGRALDIGCGDGSLSIYLAGIGFNVTGVDFSGIALERARENARRAGVKCNFIHMNALRIGEIENKFDFILEWGLLHSVMPFQREQYLEGISRILSNRGYYLSVCFNRSQYTKYPSHYTIGPSSNLIIYKSSQTELEHIFSRFFSVKERRFIRIDRRGFTPLLGNLFVLQKKMS